MSLAEELSSLKINLAQTREKFVKDWTIDQYEQLRSRQAKLHRANCTKYNDTLLQHQESIENLRKNTCLNEKALQEKTVKLAFLKQELEQLCKENDKVENYNETVSMEIQQAQQTITYNQEALKTTSTDLDQEHADLQSQADIYTQSLDMQMKKTPGGRIQFIFSSLNRKNPDLTCYFFTKLSQEDRKYIVSDCEPSVPDLDQLVDKLNQTNNLRSFVVAMRKRFKQRLASR
ncbi:kinetochore protein Spc25-like [Mytilus trossulus]|uniref:kinetochore protein Spc25-like n=1 Tax=Mytilus trossulus TaxID=6551 RepID=UPI0030051796